VLNQPSKPSTQTPSQPLSPSIDLTEKPTSDVLSPTNPNNNNDDDVLDEEGDYLFVHIRREGQYNNTSVNKKTVFVIESSGNIVISGCEGMKNLYKFFPTAQSDYNEFQCITG
jgi:hypothetical protein